MTLLEQTINIYLQEHHPQYKAHIHPQTQEINITPYNNAPIYLTDHYSSNYNIDPQGFYPLITIHTQNQQWTHRKYTHQNVLHQITKLITNNTNTT